jgi:hypothetical protein
MILTLPLINQFSALTQSGILALLIVVSYLHGRARYVIVGLILAFLGFKCLLPVARWGYVIFKWIAMLGFYIHYFQAGIGFIMSGIGGVAIFGEGLIKEMEKKRREERLRKEEEEERKREEEERKREEENMRERETEQNAKKKRTRRK